MVTTESQLLSVETDDVPNLRIIHLVGECDSAAASALTSELSKAAMDGKHVVLDAHLLTYIDSVGVLAIVSAQEALAQNRRQLRLVGAHGTLDRILRLTHFDGQIPMHETVDEAVRHIRMSSHATRN